MKLFILASLFILGHAASAAQNNGKSLTNKKYAAELTLDQGNPVKGSVRFGSGKKAVFRAYNGAEVDIRIRAICAHGSQGEVSTCWPDLSVEMDDLTSRTGKLQILPPPAPRKK